MSERLTLTVYKGPTEEQFRRVISDEAERYGGKVLWHSRDRDAGADLRLTHNTNVHVVYLPYLGGASSLLSLLIGAALDVPWLAVRIQEGSLWDYSLYHGATHRDDFSTLPEYWDEDDSDAVENNRGDADLLAELWRIPKQRVEHYLRHWGMESVEQNEFMFSSVLKGKAYDYDKNEYGSIYQMFDFLRALGGVDPMEHGVRHRIVVPPMESLRNAASPYLPT